MTTETGERITFTCGLPPRALRRNSITRSIGYRASLVREYQEQVWCAGLTTLQYADDYRWEWCDAKAFADWIIDVLPLLDEHDKDHERMRVRLERIIKSIEKKRAKVKR